MHSFDKIILNIPHSSVEGIAQAGWQDYSAICKEVQHWTDWHTDVLFNPTSNPQVEMVRHQFSRFVVDVERLPNDPLESIGQGIVYTNYNGNNRHVTDESKKLYLSVYRQYITKLQSCITPKSILIDCHSFPSDCFSDAPDICIGFNEDWSKPSLKLLDLVIAHFQHEGLIVGINSPYSNSISPICDFSYPSFMIEVNKKVYMDEQSLLPNHRFAMLQNTILELYKKLLGA